MTKFKIYRVGASGIATVEIVEAYDWQALFSGYQYSGNPIFRAEVVGGPEPIEPIAQQNA